MAKQTKLTKRSVNRVARELKILLGKIVNQENIYQLQNISGNLDSLRNISGDLKKKTDKIIKDSSYSPPFLQTIKSRKEDMKYYIDRLEDSIKRFSNRRITTENLESALIYLLDNYDYVSFSDHTLTVRTDDIFVQHDGKNVGFGPFDVKLDLVVYNKCIENMFTCKALNPILRDNHEHPNLSRYNNSSENDRNRLCTGEGKDALGLTLIQGRIGDFFDMVQQILKTDSGHPFKDIYDWM